MNNLSKSTKHRSRPVRVVALGGGTGLSTVLRGLKEHVAGRKKERVARPISDLVAVVTVTDDGGSSGRLRRDYSVLPPGDIRNCMVALSKDEPLLSQLFQYRFPTGRGLAGHSFGNLFVTALTSVTGDFPEAVRVSSQVLAIRGRIFPATAQNVTLEAELEDGTTVAGETNISRSRRPIRRVWLVPRRVRPVPEVLEAIREADLVLIGPGSLYTSIIPNLLVEQMVDVIVHSRATCVYIANLMTQPGETQHYSVADHVRAIYAHTCERLFDCAVINRSRVAPRLLRRYCARGAEPVAPSFEELDAMGLRYVVGDLLRQDGVVRHDQARLTRLLLDRFVRSGGVR
ncbi:MAG TPA: uridine diphosphate-N-acetylglucosamine-binding protein YvcK [Candidatus Acidoferrales bacterium]|nr:uridine diphosphate-N-acetylglucosamine-binding protein YvcK [Candidatus Acidoferrales bacterium]